MKYDKKWILADPDSRQFGRQISETEYEFKDKNNEPTVVDLDDYTDQDIEEVLKSYSYIFSELEAECGREQARFITAECLFETYLCRYPKKKTRNYFSSK